MKKEKNITIQYNLAMPDPSNHFFEVCVNFTGLDKNDETFSLVLPVWRPGRYFIFDFSSGVQEFSAEDSGGKKLNWKKTDKTTWEIKKNKLTAVSVNYKVYANEFSDRTRGLDEHHAFVNGTAVFMYSEKYRKLPLTLKVFPFGDWKVTTGLENYGNEENLFYAPGYDYLSDAPLETGLQNDFDFDVEGKKHVISFFGEANYNRQRLIEDFTKIIKKNYEFWGSIPYEKYVFLVHCSPLSSGGTEHINSTVVGVKPTDFDSDKSYGYFLRLISHEFFHTWNVKQLKPKGLTPYDFLKENYTSELWIAEGGTSYYDGLMLLRTGQMSLQEFYDEITRGIEDEKRRPGNRIQPVADSSFDAWVKFWRRSPNAFNSESNYYTKGSYVCIVLDLEIRHCSGNKHSLDDVFKTMFETFPLDVNGYTNNDFMEVCGNFAGKKLNQFFNDYVYGIKPIDWEKYLSYAGLNVTKNDSVITPVVGLNCSKNENKVTVQEVLKGSSAEKAGLKTGDEIIACDGTCLNYEEIEKRIKNLKTDDKIAFTIFRNNKLGEYSLKLQELKLSNYRLSKVKSPAQLQKEIYENWLKTRW